VAPLRIHLAKQLFPFNHPELLCFQYFTRNLLLFVDLAGILNLAPIDS
jgi:hypothetical protein